MVSVSLFQETNIPEDSGARKMENFTFKAHRRAFLFALLITSIYAFGYAVKGVVWFFFLLSQRIFPQIEQKRVGLPESRTYLKSFCPLSIYMLHQGFDRELPLPKNLPNRTGHGPQYSTNLEVWKADHSLALRFRIPFRPDQSRHATEITNKQSLNSELMNIPKFLDFSSQC